MPRYLPNLLSFLRLAAAPFACWLILDAHNIAALLVFAMAGLSDGLDGFVARHWRATSLFGAWLDPAADKLLMLLCYGALLSVGAAPRWLVALVVARDLAIASGWLMARLFALPLRLEALAIGKVSTLLQLVYIGTWLVLLAFDAAVPRIMLTAAWTVALFTLLSGGAYALLFLRALLNGHRTV